METTKQRESLPERGKNITDHAEEEIGISWAFIPNEWEQTNKSDIQLLLEEEVHYIMD